MYRSGTVDLHHLSACGRKEQLGNARWKVSGGNWWLAALQFERNEVIFTWIVERLKWIIGKNNYIYQIMETLH
jgi:hypothetical protein